MKMKLAKIKNPFEGKEIPDAKENISTERETKLATAPLQIFSSQVEFERASLKQG